MGGARGILRLLQDENTLLVVLTVAAGVMGGVVAFGFYGLTELATRLLYPGATDVVDGFLRSPWWMRLLIPAAGGLIAGSIRALFVPPGRARGFSEILEAVSMGSGVLRVRRATPTGLSSLATYGSGGSVGREGAIVQISAAIASWMGRKLKLTRSRLRMLVGSGVAAGISAAYRTPIAGALFALEVIYRRFAFEELGPIMVAAVAATFTAYALVGETPIYDGADFEAGGVAQLLPCLLIGLLAGPAAVMFQRALELADRLYRKIPLPLPLKTTSGGLLVGAVAIAVPEVTGNGYEPLREILAGRAELVAILLLLAAKVLATSITVGSGGVGGVFTPTLLVGATLGGSVGIVATQHYPSLGSPGSYAMIGMGSVLAASTRAPIMAILMVFETTRQYELVLPLMLSSVVAYAGARLLQPDSIYTAELRRRGIPLAGEREADVLRHHTVGEVVRTNVPLVPHTLTLDALLDIFRRTRELFLYVGDEQGRLLGVIDLHDLKDFLEGGGYGNLILAADLVRPFPAVEASATLLEAEQRLRAREVGQVPVVDSHATGRYLGVVTRKDLLATLERALLDEGLAHEPTVEEQGGRGRLEYLPVPERWKGIALGELPETDLQGRVLVVRRERDGAVEMRSDPGLILETGDQLVILPD